jgi:hypothetical protein
MKNAILTLILALVPAFAATEVKLIKQEAGSVPVMRPNVATDVVIDSSEFDTATVYFNLTDTRFAHWSDTLGQVFLRCDDSAGTDSVAGRLIWQGNPKANLTGLWEAIDSVSIAAASGTETQTSKAVVNSKRYQALRFILRNQLVPAAGKKSVCRDIVLNRQRRLVD